MEGCVFEKKKKNKNQNEKGIESNISQSKDWKEIATHADFFIEGMSQSFMEINCK